MTPTKSPALMIVIAAIVVIAIVFGAVYYVQNGKSWSSASRAPLTPAEQQAQQQGSAFVTKVAQEAVNTTSIEISGCKPDPTSARFKMGSSVRFVNNDAVPHTISFSPDHTFVVPKTSKKYITFDFWKFPGVRKYSCDDNSSVGVGYITAPTN